MRMVDLITKKKNGYELNKEEIYYMIESYVNGSIPDYQMSAMLMAICFQGLSEEEQYILTMAMLESGEQMDLSQIKGICVDKHSTGGVGDKTSLVALPIAAACGLKVAKMSGRGLGHTGGTLDKLESIKGFDINVSTGDFYKQVDDISLAIVGQTLNITPADKKLYALRDVTATVDNIGLIASSIMSKKLASGAHSIVLDVKVGEGAFMKDIDSATKLAEALVKIGKKCGRKVSAILTDMSKPLGNMVGNSLEVIEAIETLKGRGPKEFEYLCKRVCVELLMMTNFVNSEDEALNLINEKIESGEALEKLRELIKYQHGDPNVIDDYSLLPLASKKIEVLSEEEGYVKKIDALGIGLSAMLLGAGRESKNDSIDFGVGIEVLKKVGDKVAKGEPLVVIYSNGKKEQEAIDKVLESYVIVSEIVDKKDIIFGIVRD